PLDEAHFERLLGRVRSYFQGRETFVCDGSACADPAFALPVRVVCDLAWHALFARCLLRGPVSSAPLEPLTILVAADMHADPTPASSTSRAAATPSASACRARGSRRSGAPSASAACWRTSSSTR